MHTASNWNKIEIENLKYNILKFTLCSIKKQSSHKKNIRNIKQMGKGEICCFKLVSQSDTYYKNLAFFTGPSCLVDFKAIGVTLETELETVS